MLPRPWVRDFGAVRVPVSPGAVEMRAWSGEGCSQPGGAKRRGWRQLWVPGGGRPARGVWLHGDTEEGAGCGGRGRSVRSGVLGGKGHGTVSAPGDAKSTGRGRPVGSGVLAMGCRGARGADSCAPLPSPPQPQPPVPAMPGQGPPPPPPPPPPRIVRGGGERACPRRLTSPAGAAIGCGRRSPKRRWLRSARTLRAAAAPSARGARALPPPAASAGAGKGLRGGHGSPPGSGAGVWQPRRPPLRSVPAAVSRGAE